MTDILNVLGVAIVVAWLSGAVPAKAQERELDWLIVPGQRVGPITAGTSEAMLEVLFGPENIERADIQMGEGFTEPGTVIYPDIPDQRLEVVWQSASRSNPRWVRLTGESSLWATADGLSLGSTLKEIEDLNGWPFRLAGFGWDYGGTILDCGRGRLSILGCVDPLDPSRRTHERLVIVRLLPVRLADPRPEYDQVLGDREFSSGHPAMQALNPRVRQMIVSLSQ